MKGVILLLIGIIVIGGTTIGLGYAGIINIPGITPKKQPKPAPQGEEKSETKESPKEPEIPKPSIEEPKKIEVPKEPEQQPKVVQRVDGTDRVAKLWSSMDSENLSKVLAKWNDGDVVAILAKMDDKKLSELLNTIASTDPDKAARLSQGIKALDKGGTK